MSQHRKPPLQLHRVDLGVCRYCGQACEPRRNWHEDCLHEYKLVSWPSYARLIVEGRDRGICSYCGTDCSQDFIARPFGLQHMLWHRQSHYLVIDGRVLGEDKLQRGGVDFHVPYTSVQYRSAWEVEHAFPLELVDRTRPDALKYWQLDNLRTACLPCHKRKTAREAQARAKERRIRRKGQLKAGPKTARERRQQKIDDWKSMP